MNVQERHTVLIRLTIIFISYVALLQVLYALQPLFVTVPFMAIATTVYILVIQPTRILPSATSFIINDNDILSYTGSKVKTTTHEGDLQSLILQKTEEVLQTDLQHFRKVWLYIYIYNSNILISIISIVFDRTKFIDKFNKFRSKISTSRIR